MAIESLLLGLALLILVVIFLARPLLKNPQQLSAPPDRRSQLEQDKEAYLAEIRALDFDHETGKVPTEVYEQQRAQLVIEAAVLLKAIDEIPVAGDDIYAQIESAVATRRQDHAISSNGQAGFCAQCGQPLDADDKFCSRCGQPVKLVQPTL